MNLSKIWSQIAHWVFFNLLKENSQLSSVFQQTVELERSPMERVKRIPVTDGNWW